jgi:hypothetical protein
MALFLLIIHRIHSHRTLSSSFLTVHVGEANHNQALGHAIMTAPVRLSPDVLASRMQLIASEAVTAPCLVRALEFDIDQDCHML